MNFFNEYAATRIHFLAFAAISLAIAKGTLLDEERERESKKELFKQRNEQSWFNHF